MAVALAETGYSFRGAKRLHLMSVHRSEPMLLVGDVQGSVAWYCRLLDCQADHGLEEFDRRTADGEVLLMLHRGERAVFRRVTR